ncbi:tail fiber protein [Flavobacterium muglaense]|uniref:Tail fiber protein n=1 Tax=Flavobacterium muglaense TaxID=2764716 RepID=A0A923N290_9FLAO|nr:tail fiber protein [Flavobacterium muglaense]MBC5837874.1 tail fiber protein [Flavobacterium muglaense]MBC5844343.1 tail fiber protein [Flavobacterium muglaense]
MRTKLLSFLMLLTVAINYGQSSANVAGIAIQGIARDNNNTARTSATISLTFRIYYGSNVAIYEVTRTVTTDAFGVFSAVLEPGETNNIVIANTQAYLRISEGSTTISDEKLKQVPYAIAASNGVPTGSIMPYIGTTAPAGWIFCDGSSLPADALGGAALRALVGDYAPDLRGMFIRGAGQNGNTTNAAEIQPNTLKAVQSSDNKSHKHGSGDLINNNGGRHNHGSADRTNLLVVKDGTTTSSGLDNSSNEINQINAPQIPFDGEHTHLISGSTASTGGSESRPINYGVNYIIKL